MFGGVNVWRIAKSKVVAKKFGEWNNSAIRILIISNLDGFSVGESQTNPKFAKLSLC